MRRRLLSSLGIVILACATLLATTATDDFSGTLGGWTVTTGAMQIAGGQARPNNAEAYAFMRRTSETWLAAHSSQAVVHANFGGMDQWLTVRHQSSGDFYGLMCHISIGLRIYSYISASFTSLEDLSHTCTDGHTYKFAISGTTFSVTDNGTPVTVTVGSGGTLSNGNPGIGGSVTTAGWDDWVGDGVDVGGAPPTCTRGLLLLGVGCDVNEALR